MAKKYSKKVRPTQKKPKKLTKKKLSNRTKTVPKTTTKNTKTKIASSKSQPKKKIEKHKFELKSAFEFKDIIGQVKLLKNGKYGALSEDGEFVIFSIDSKNQLKSEISFYLPGANYFGQLGNGILIFNSFDTISFWELKEKKLNKIGEYNTIFKLVTYFIEPIDNNYCAISGPNRVIELVEFNTKNKKITVNYLDYKKTKKVDYHSLPVEVTGCLYYQKKHKRLLSAHCTDNTLRIWDCDVKKKKYDIFKEVDNICTFTGKVIHELNNKIIIGGKCVIIILNNDNYNIESFIPLGFNDIDIFSMEVINYYNFKEFVVCGLRNGKILGIDIDNKNVEFVKKKIYDTGKDNEMNIQDGKITFYGELVSSIIKVENKNMILVSSHDHTLKLIEY